MGRNGERRARVSGFIMLAGGSGGGKAAGLFGWIRVRRRSGWVGGSQHRHGAEPLGLELAGQLMGQPRRKEAGLFDGATAAAIEDHLALGIGRLDLTKIHEPRQLADLAAGSEGGHHEEGETHPRQAPAVATRRNFTTATTLRASGAGSGPGQDGRGSGLPFPLANWDGSGPRPCSTPASGVENQSTRRIRA